MKRKINQQKIKNEARLDLKSAVIFVLLVGFIFLLILPEDLIYKPSIIGQVISKVLIVGNNPPTFDHTIPNFSVFQNESFYYDINCSDLDFIDSINYTTNFTFLNINQTSGVINLTPGENSTIIFNQSFVGNHTVEWICTDTFNLNTSIISVFEVIDANEPPILGKIGPKIATEGELFTLIVTAFDYENDTLSFGDSTTLFIINNETGLINFTPTVSQVGNHSINITVYDGEFYDWEVFILTIVRGPYCGDGSCGIDESCSTCSVDCGSCPTPPPAEESDEQGGQAEIPSESSGGGKGAPPPPQIGGAREPSYRCDEKWECSVWSICSLDNLRTRDCIDINKCPTENNKPEEVEACKYQPTCFDGIQNGDEDGVDCGGVCAPCIVENCFDGAQNQNEEGVDCGGVCAPCTVEKFAKIPFVEYHAKIVIPKNFPWILILLLLLLIIATVTSDQLYMRHIKKKKLEEFKKEYRKYKPIRKKIYKSLAIVTLITIITAFHMYYFSNDTSKMLRYAWIPIIVSLFIPLIVTIVIRKYEYYEYKKKKKMRMLNTTHKREIYQLMNMENKLLIDIETKLRIDFHKLGVMHKFDGYPQLYKKLSPLYGLLTNLEKIRKERIKNVKIDTEIFNDSLDLAENHTIENETLNNVKKEFPEFKSLLEILKGIIDNINIDTHDLQEDLIDEIEEISKPHLKTVIESDPKLVFLYNKITDLYDYFSQKHTDLDNNSKEAADIERKFDEIIKDTTKNALLMDLIAKDKDLVLLYNSMVELFDHYTKKAELRTKIKGL
jgi:hypothetical protein